MRAINPATGETVAEYDEPTPQAVDAAVAAAHEAFGRWRETQLGERAALMRRAADNLRDRREQLADLMATEMGKPVREGRAEVGKCAWVCEHYAENAAVYLADEPVVTEASRSFVTFQPLGVVLAVMPWNFPLWQVFRFAAPALMAGNVGLLKHASNVPGCALAIEDVFASAGFPPSVFSSLLVGAGAVPDLIRDPRVRAVTLTGSTEAGRAVARVAGDALKKTVLELGGSDPYIVLEDADLDAAVEACVTARLINSGQSCIAAKRFVVVEAIRPAFESRFVRAMWARRVGDPLDEQTEVGPMARRALRDELHGQVVTSVERGARVLLGAEVPGGPGAFYPPTVLTDVPRGCPAYGDELFGPVAAIIPARDQDDAVKIANDSVFGLGAAVFTRDTSRGEAIAARRLEAGSCFVNTFVRSDPRLPFGGIKASGYGRELSSFGIREFVNVKTVYVA